MSCDISCWTQLLYNISDVHVDPLVCFKGQNIPVGQLPSCCMAFGQMITINL